MSSLDDSGFEDSRVKDFNIKFCPECNNMLYPREDFRNRVLLFSCRNCDYSEDSPIHMVYRNNIITVPLEKSSAVSGLANDPTLPRTSKRTCPQCGNSEAVFFQSHDRRRDTPMTLYFVCTENSCSHLWTDEQVDSSFNLVK